MRKLRAGSNNNDYISDINVTPFVDVLLVLLVMFMVISTVPSSQIEIELPDGYSNVKNKKSENIIISIKKNKLIFIKNKEVRLNSLLPELLSYKKNYNDTIYIRADKDLSYGFVIEIINKIKKSKFKNVSLATDLAP